jgi:regulator of sirC expression with transglutaminase-like and TPR domain
VRAEVAERFGELVHLPEAQLEERLDEVALLVAAAGRDLDRRWVAGQLARLDALALDAGPGLDGLLDLLFARQGLRGDVAGYGDPQGSYLDLVLDRGVGLPIALSLLTVVVGRRTGLTLRLVGLPGHVVARHDEGELTTFIDAFDGGRRFGPAGVAALLARVHGRPVAVEPGWLEPTPASAIALRLLTNLRQRALATTDVALLSWVAPLRAVVPGAQGDDVALLTRLRASLS